MRIVLIKEDDMIRRNTMQKQEILRAITGEGMHRTAEEVFQEVQKTDPAIGLATVYRNLNLMCQEGLIQKLGGEDSVTYDGNPKPHDHIRCIKCGKIMDAPSEYNAEMDAQLEQRTGMKVIRHTVIYQGVCTECLEKEEREEEKKDTWN